ncbi:MAG: zinc-finger domain-containing protein [Rhodospirillales bacterium]|jgi:uncharacterized Zn-finger protein|nr:zinc-finger domain-containing protein [Rhodospirillales bacterium]
MDAEEPIYVNDRRVACDGGGGALGHPRVFLKIGPENQIVCPYCSRRFIYADDSEAGVAR